MRAPEAEQALIGALLIDGEAVDRVAAIVKPDDFKSPTCRRIFEVILRVREEWEAVDYVTVITALGPVGERAIGGVATLTALINCCPTSLHAEHYARMIAADAVAQPAGWLAR